MTINLMLRARLKASCHQIRHLFSRPPHMVWRHYRWWGLETLQIWCTCGKEFK